MPATNIRRSNKNAVNLVSGSQTLAVVIPGFVVVSPPWAPSRLTIAMSNAFYSCTLYPRAIIHIQAGGVECEEANICGFIDGTLRRCCRPGRLPGEDLQREIYDGHHRAHGLVW